MPVLFGAPGAPDLVASAFYWLSGWQEAASRVRDAHGRFPYAASLQAALGCAGVPVVDRYREALAEALSAAGVPLARRAWRGRPWAVAVTYDVDQTRKRRLGTLARAAARKDGRRAEAVRQALREPDPFRRGLEWIGEGGGTVFLKAAARGPWDVRYPLGARLRRWADRFREGGGEVGLHPSYHAHDHPGHLAAERCRLEAFLGAPPAAVRQHFLRFDPALTPPLQAAAGFRVDSTLGFAEREGFRRGTAHPFRLYDLAADAPLDLWEAPLAVMDTTLFGYRGLGPEGAEAAAWAVMEAARAAGGCAVLLWHNNAADALDHPGEARVLDRLRERAARAGAALLPLGEAVRAANGQGQGSAPPLAY